MPRFRSAVMLLVPSVLLAGCANSRDLLPDMTQSKLFPSSVRLFSSSDTTAAQKAPDIDLSFSKPAGPDDLVDAAGQCSAAATAAASPSSAPPAAAPAAGAKPSSPSSATLPLAAGGVALGMTECAVVSRAGPPSRVEIGSGEGGARRAVLTFQTGPWPGIYTFQNGRLKVVDEIPNLKPAKPARKKAKSKKSG